MSRRHLASTGDESVLTHWGVVNHGNFFKEERGFYRISDDKYFFFTTEKVFLIHVQDLTISRNATKIQPNFLPNRI